MEYQIMRLLLCLMVCSFGIGEVTKETNAEFQVTEEGTRAGPSPSCIRSGKECISPDECCSNTCDKEEGAMAGRCGRSETGGSCKGVLDCKKCRKPGNLCITTCTSSKCTCKCTAKTSGSIVGPDGICRSVAPSPEGPPDISTQPPIDCSGVKNPGTGNTSCTYSIVDVDNKRHCNGYMDCSRCPKKCASKCWNQDCVLGFEGRFGWRTDCYGGRDNSTCQCYCRAKPGQYCQTLKDCDSCPKGCHRTCEDTTCTGKCPGSGNPDCFAKCNNSTTKDPTTCACTCPIPIGGKCARSKDCVKCPEGCDRECWDQVCTSECPGTGDPNCNMKCAIAAQQGKAQYPTRCVCNCKGSGKLCEKCAQDDDCAPCEDSARTVKCLPFPSDGPYVCQCA